MSARAPALRSPGARQGHWGHRGRSAARRLSLMAAVAVAVFAGVGSLIAVQTLDHARDAAREDAAFQANLAARSIDDALTLAQDTLAGMAPSFPTAQLIATPAKCQLRFTGLGSFPKGHLDVVLNDGRVACSSLAESGAPPGATHAGAVWASSVMPAQPPVISQPFRDRLTGARSVAVVTALAGPDGRPLARLAIVLDLEPLSGSLAATYAGPRGFAFAVTAGETTLSRPGTAAAGGSTSVTDIPATLNATSQVELVPWRIDAGISEAEAIGPVRSILFKGGALAAGGLIVLLILLFLVDRQIARPWDRLAETEHKLRESQERFRALLLGARDYAIVMLDPDGRVVSWSASAQLLDGYAEDDIVGRYFDAFFPPEQTEAGVPARILDAAGDAGRSEYEGVRLRQDGSRYWARTVLTARSDADGVLLGYVSVTHDATIRREIELTAARMNAELEERVEERTAQLEQQAAELSAANAELRAFSYSISHDLRAPLRAINGFATILTEACSAELSDEANHCADRILRNASTLSNMVDGLLSLSASQQLTINAATVDLAEMARNAWEELGPELEGRDVDFVLHPLPPGRGDPRLLRQVLANLLGNAVKYSRRREHAVIEVGSRTTEAATVYFVRDNGAGFDMRHAEGLFKVFQRLHRAEDFPGTGIGLASVQRIITRHGGQVWAEAEPDRGATFYFTLGPVPEHPVATGALDVPALAGSVR